MALRTLNPNAYTVGWICALSVELAAAAQLLDEEHGELGQSSHDNTYNMYTLGSIGKHNVVIACLPAGSTGISPAAAIAAQMKVQFPSLRFGLMVGIGGGVPRLGADLRLGDVVVSQPFAGHGGVIQYDFGKSTLDGFIRTGFLGPPPSILLSAISKLQAQSIRRRDVFSSHMSRFDGLPEFTRDGAGPDLLFEPTYDHVGGPTCESCDKAQLVKRTPETRATSKVHYGAIASMNLVMRSGRERDRVSSELGGVLCFEMEAGGLMNNLPCLVIRGICDYADSHKNKTWQPYAAAAAAAYTKALLLSVPENIVRDGHEATKNLLSSGHAQRDESTNSDKRHSHKQQPIKINISAKNNSGCIIGENRCSISGFSFGGVASSDP